MFPTYTSTYNRHMTRMELIKNLKQMNSRLLSDKPADSWVGATNSEARIGILMGWQESSVSRNTGGPVSTRC